MSADSLIIGTAGHIDHGKTTLVRAMTGVDTDRLDEEKRRGITIVLGFAPITLPGGQVAGVVDVPGHEKFVRTMVAGAGGVDVGLLVVSAEEGVMPQTREHVEILAMLGVPELVVALTRADLVDDELIELADLDVRELLEGTPWPEAPIIPTSGITGEGVEAAREALAEAAGRLPARRSTDVFRLPVDRSFSIRGFGTVATGTTRDGTLKPGQTLEVLPGRRSVRVRGVQVHGADADEVGRGTRVAINLQGVEGAAVPAGAWLATPKALACSDRIDVGFTLLESAPRPLPNNARVRFLVGTAELLAVVRLMDPDGGPAPEQIEPGGRGLAQLALEEETGAVAGDRFVLRAESPMVTIGGGTILDPEPPLLRRRERPAAGRLLGVLQDRGASGQDRFVAFLRRAEGRAVDLHELRRRLPPSVGDVRTVALTAVEAGEAVALTSEPPSWTWTGAAARWVEPTRAVIAAHHAEHPLLNGPLLAEVRQALLPPPGDRVFAALVGELEAAAEVERRGDRLALPDHSAAPSSEHRTALDALVAALAEGGAHPPKLADAVYGLRLPPDGLGWLVDEGEVHRVADDYYVARAPFEALVGRLAAHAEAGDGYVTTQAFKEISGLTRRHAIPFLEYLDRTRLTSRTPDGRVFKRLPEGWGTS
ncbi:MAG: selenocysteine-specific translation elongation factor [Proteobacteria bacterium]|nr:selenocysteine-specific translation elongation factor [Pseudomonadota bacterium]